MQNVEAVEILKSLGDLVNVVGTGDLIEAFSALKN